MSGLNKARRLEPLHDDLSTAERLVREQYGDTVSVEKAAKGLMKFGQANLGTTTEDVTATGGTLVLSDDSNLINEVVSSDPADTQDIIIQGHTVAGGLFIPETRNVPLNGLIPVPITPLARAQRLINDSSNDFAGIIQVYESGLGRVHLSVSGEHNQSLKCALSVDYNLYLFITGVTIGVLKRTSASVDFLLKTREIGKTWRTRANYSSSTASGPQPIPISPPLIVPPNHDVKFVASSTASDTDVDAIIHGHYAIITS